MPINYTLLQKRVKYSSSIPQAPVAQKSDGGLFCYEFLHDFAPCSGGGWRWLPKKQMDGATFIIDDVVDAHGGKRDEISVKSLRTSFQISHKSKAQKPDSKEGRF